MAALPVGSGIWKSIVNGCDSSDLRQEMRPSWRQSPPGRVFVSRKINGLGKSGSRACLIGNLCLISLKETWIVPRFREA
jgi:hypothetical protein